MTALTWETVSHILSGAWQTLQVALGAWIVAAIAGLILAILQELGPRWVRGPLSGIVLALRSIPELVVLYLIFFGIGAYGIFLGSMTTAIVAFGITQAAYVSEYYRAGFMIVPESQREAGLSLGLSPLKVTTNVVVPQAFLFDIPPLLNTFIGLLKLAALAYAVGVSDMIYRAQSEIRRIGLIIPIMGLVLIAYVVVVLPLTKGVAAVERRLRVRTSA